MGKECEEVSAKSNWMLHQWEFEERASRITNSVDALG